MEPRSVGCGWAAGLASAGPVRFLEGGGRRHPREGGGLSKVCTCFDGNAISNVVRGWLPSLRKVYGGDTVAFPLNLSGEVLDRISGCDESALIPPALRTDRGIRNDPMYLMFFALCDYLAELPADEPVMIYDGAD